MHDTSRNVGSIHIPAEQPDPSRASPVNHSSFPAVAATLLPLAGLNSLATGEGPIAVLFDAPCARLYVTNRGDGTVSVFDSSSKTLLETIAVAPHSNSLALDAAGGTAYMSVKNAREA